MSSRVYGNKRLRTDGSFVLTEIKPSKSLWVYYDITTKDRVDLFLMKVNENVVVKVDTEVVEKEDTVGPFCVFYVN